MKVLATKAGKPYLSLRAGDRTGGIGAVWWDYDRASEPVKAAIRAGGLIDLSGDVDSYKDKLQLKITGVAPAGAADMRDFEKSSQYDPTEMWREFDRYLHSFENTWISRIAFTIVARYRPAFQLKPAATGMHHAFRHGLLEHTLQMLQTADALFKLPFYADALNKDLCMFGIMFHDFGKIFEYGDAPAFSRTVSGVKVPHIPKMAAIIYNIAQLMQIPDEVCDELMSIILSHHRFLEWGSPCTPSSPEALFVHYIDNLHGDVFGVIQRIQDDTSSDLMVKHGFGMQTYTVPKKRFSELLKELEGLYGRDELQDDAGPSGEEAAVDGF